MTQQVGIKLSDIPWDSLYIGMPVISSRGVRGRVVTLLDDTQDRLPSIWIDWENAKESWVFHHQADKVTCL